MTEKQEYLLKKIVSLRGFDFDTKLKIGNEIFTINDLKNETNFQITNLIVSLILKKQYEFYVDKDKIIENIKKEQMTRHSKFKNILKEMRIKEYEEWIEMYKKGDVWCEWEQRYLTNDELKERIKSLEKLLEREKNIV